MNEFTREELEQIADTDHVQCGEASALARMALAAMDSEPVAWIVHARTGDQLTTDGGYVANAEGILGLHSTPLYRHAQPAQTGVDDDVRNIIGLLETNEWAEHCTETVLGSRLEAEITRLVGSPQPAPVVPEEATPNNIEIIASARSRDCAVFQWDEDQRNAAADAWNACRDTMLQADNYPSKCSLRKGIETIRNSGISVDVDKIQSECEAGNSPVAQDCWCHTCRPVTMSDMRFVVCPDCGNKRCPRANDHRNDCTGSNEPGQSGSAYPAAPQQEVKSALEHGMQRYAGAMQNLAEGDK